MRLCPHPRCRKLAERKNLRKSKVHTEAKFSCESCCTCCAYTAPLGLIPVWGCPTAAAAAASAAPPLRSAALLLLQSGSPAPCRMRDKASPYGLSV